MALEDAKTEIDRAITRQGFRGLAYENAFAGATSFLRRTYTKDLAGVDLAITGAPFDQVHQPRLGFHGLCMEHALARTLVNAVWTIVEHCSVTLEVSRTNHAAEDEERKPIW